VVDEAACTGKLLDQYGHLARRFTARSAVPVNSNALGFTTGFGDDKRATVPVVFYLNLLGHILYFSLFPPSSSSIWRNNTQEP
jgi:hypothetical protein